MKGLSRRKAVESGTLREEKRIHLFVKEQPVKVICYNCGVIIEKDSAWYILAYDCYLCDSCYLRLVDGESVRLPNWKKRGV